MPMRPPGQDYRLLPVALSVLAGAALFTRSDPGSRHWICDVLVDPMKLRRGYTVQERSIELFFLNHTFDV